MSEKMILTDIDGCILDWDVSFRNWMNAKGIHKENPEHLNKYDLGLRWNVPEGEIHSLIEEFNLSEAMGECVPYKDSVKYVKKLAEDGHKFVAVTSMGGNDRSQELRKQNMCNLFGGAFVDHHFLPLNTSKREILSNWKGSGLWWIEDKYENALVGSEIGLRSILLEHAHNEESDHTGLLRARNWEEIYNYVNQP